MTARGPWSLVYPGKRVYLKTLRPADVDVRTIAHSLANQCRFIGHVEQHYSVAQHCVHVSYLCDRVDAPWGLLHDGAEAYLGDVPRQIKHSPEMALFREWEARVLGVICKRFGLQGEEPSSVKFADKVMLSVESNTLLQRDLIPKGWEKWDRMRDVYVSSHPDRALPDLTNPWSPKLSEKIFLDRFHFLFGAL